MLRNCRSDTFETMDYEDTDLGGCMGDMKSNPAYALC